MPSIAIMACEWTSRVYQPTERGMEVRNMGCLTQSKLWGTLVVACELLTSDGIAKYSWLFDTLPWVGVGSMLKPRFTSISWSLSPLCYIFLIDGIRHK